VRVFTVDVTLRWGDQIVRIERWTGGASPHAELDLRTDAHGWPCVAGIPLEIGAPIDVPLGDGLAPYRSDHRTALVARVELVSGSRGRRAVSPPRRRLLAAALGALALHGVLGLSAFARPALAPDDARVDRYFKVTLPVRVIYAPSVDSYEDLRERETDERACVDPACGAPVGRPPVYTGLTGLVRGDAGCTPARRVHYVSQGETLTSIAASYGIADYRAIYNEVLNEELVAQRPDPNRIFPGDVVKIPGEGLCSAL
jgi:hypothetical protein